MTDLVERCRTQIEWTAKNCPNAPYVPIKTDDAHALIDRIEADAARLEKVESLLKHRDQFIVSRGLWGDYVGTLRELSHD